MLYEMDIDPDNLTKEPPINNESTAIHIDILEPFAHEKYTVPSGNENIEFSEFYKNAETDTSNWDFNDMYVRSNSPIASNCNSDIDTDYSNSIIEDEYTRTPSSSSYYVKKSFHKEDVNGMSRRSNVVKTHNIVSSHQSFSDEENQISSPTNKRYKKFTYDDIEKSLSKYYDKNDKNFTDTDLLITYLSGMRTIYTISRNITQLKSYSVAMSTISITICLAVIAPFVKDFYWGAYLISAGNAFATVLISLSRYLKFDSNSAQYAFMAKQFNKLETRLECDPEHHSASSHKTREIESTMMEMNEYIQELIPEETVQLFPLIYQTNIMQFIKKTELYKKNLIIRFRDIKNEIHYILYKWNSVGEQTDHINSKHTSKTPQQEREKNRVLYLMDLKEKTKKELMQYKSIYIQMDELFKKEIRYAETHQSCFGCSLLFKPDYDFSKLNPIVRDYLRLVITD
jgi:hypothetical protein